jgi:hypothetical protein
MPRIAAAGACAIVLLTMPVRGDEPSLDEVLSRAGAYVIAYHRAVATVIAEERYVQILSKTLEVGGPATSTPALQKRTLVSDFAIISGAAGEPAWMAFRDVREVDGDPVRRDDDRIRRILTEDSQGLTRAMAISRESARYNLGADLVVRTINVPTLALDFLLPDARQRFSFKRAGSREQDGILAWQIAFREKARPTIIRTPDGGSVPVQGSFLIDPATGRVLWSTVTTLDGGLATIDVRYAIEPRLEIAVPVQMHESYTIVRDRSTLTADATYTNYRRFETAVRLIIPKTVR